MRKPPSRGWRSLLAHSVAVLASMGLLVAAHATLGQEPRTEVPWGDPSAHLRARVVAVAPETDEQKPDFATARRVAEYAHADDVTLLVELSNISDKAVALQGVRYGDSVSLPWPGKSVTDTFAKHLFACEYFDRTGKAIELPRRESLTGDTMLSLSSGSAETIEPGKSLVMLIRPTKWDLTLARNLSAGEFRIRVRYHGPSPATIREIVKHWPDKDLGKALSEEVVTPTTVFRIAEGPKAPELVWGKPEGGLRAAVELRSAATIPQGRRDTVTGTFPYGSRLTPLLHVENVSDKDVSFSSETWRQEDGATLVDERGKEMTIGHGWYGGWALFETWTLKPGQSAVLTTIDLGIAANEASAKQFSHPIAPATIPEPGKYALRYTMNFGQVQRQDQEGRKVLPRQNDFVGTLVTGMAPIVIRERTKADEPPTMTGRIEFRGPDGKPVKAGRFELRVQAGMKPLLKGELRGAPIEVRECPIEPLMVDLFAPGFEESRIYDIALLREGVTPVVLTPSDPVRFRLVTRDGKPVAGADVRYFNQSKFAASSGPYPTAGRKGDVWARSSAEGEVVLDMVRKFDPLDRKLGNDIYYFYIEPIGLAPLFVGPVQAGENLGDIKVGPYLEARGEIRGTPEELAVFAAEWDQPESMKSGNGEAGWDYAESAKLQTKRVGDKLTFHLTNLRPGQLRIVSRFKAGGKPGSHVYSRREPNEDDVVFEVDLQESRDDLVVTNAERKAESGKR